MRNLDLGMCLKSVREPVSSWVEANPLESTCRIPRAEHYLKETKHVFTD